MIWGWRKSLHVKLEFFINISNHCRTRLLHLWKPRLFIHHRNQFLWYNFWFCKGSRRESNLSFFDALGFRHGQALVLIFALEIYPFTIITHGSTLKVFDFTVSIITINLFSNIIRYLLFETCHQRLQLIKGPSLHLKNSAGLFEDVLGKHLLISLWVYLKIDEALLEIHFSVYML